MTKIFFVLAALVFFAPAVAYAAPVLSFDPTPDDTFNAYEDDTYTVSVKLTGYMEDTGVDFYVKGPIGESSEEERLISSYGYITNATYVFSWDGKFGGSEPDPGTYRVRLVGDDLYGNDTNVLTHEFEFVTEEPAPEPEPEPEPEEPADEPEAEPEPDAVTTPAPTQQPTQNVDEDEDTDETSDATDDSQTDESDDDDGEDVDETEDEGGLDDDMILWVALGVVALGIAGGFALKMGKKGKA